MLVYGDRSEYADPTERLNTIAAQISAIQPMTAGLERHAALASALIEAGRVQQGVEDAGASALQLSEFVYRLAASFVRSWDSGFRDLGALPPVPVLSGRLELREPEGFAFYALYPEAFIDAARRLALAGPPRVIGIRSIGTTLGAVVAAALNAPPPLTVRPFGDPFARRVDLPEECLEEGTHYVIVDEGPGLSGSSFGAVADWLEEHGVPLERIAFVPSHGGEPGPQASDEHLMRWRRAQRVPAEFDESFLSARFGPLELFSTGSPWERRKFVATRDGTRLLLKFAGLGAIGERKLAMARALHAAALTPEPLGLVHGFLIERWCDDARPLEPGDVPVDQIGHYIGTRACLFRDADATGASIEQLLVMSRRNIGLALGTDAARRLECWDARAPDLERRIVRVRTDNKLDQHEWLRLAGGRLVKTDALDHHRAHDLIGCQDAAWDMAGAIAEFALDAAALDRLIAASGLDVDRELLQFYCIAYSAFRLGQAKLGRLMVAANSATNAALRSSAERHAGSLRDLLHQDTCARNSRESALD